MNMDDELKKRFLSQKIKDFGSGNLKPFPTILCEQNDPRITELVRQFCMFAEPMIPFLVKDNLSCVPERLEFQKGNIAYGDLYIDVSVN